MNLPAPSKNALVVSGAVMVVGGGVAGVQAALDLSALGFKVFLVEKSAAIGGVMARLDKTFPTNDCSLCILAPKLVEAGRDANIDILTKTELVALSGRPGDFVARLRKRPRYIDEELCNGCGQAVKNVLRIKEMMLERIGIVRERFLIDWASAAEGPNFVKIITSFTHKIRTFGPLGRAENADAQGLRQRLTEAAEAARGRRFRTGLINASREMMKAGDLSRPAITALVRDRCGKGLDALSGEGARHE